MSWTSQQLLCVKCKCVCIYYILYIDECLQACCAWHCVMCQYMAACRLISRAIGHVCIVAVAQVECCHHLWLGQLVCAACFCCMHRSLIAFSCAVLSLVLIGWMFWRLMVWFPGKGSRVLVVQFMCKSEITVTVVSCCSYAIVTSFANTCHSATSFA